MHKIFRNSVSQQLSPEFRPLILITIDIKYIVKLMEHNVHTYNFLWFIFIENECILRKITHVPVEMFSFYSSLFYRITIRGRFLHFSVIAYVSKT